MVLQGSQGRLHVKCTVPRLSVDSVQIFAYIKHNKHTVLHTLEHTSIGQNYFAKPSQGDAHRILQCLHPLPWIVCFDQPNSSFPTGLLKPRWGGEFRTTQSAAQETESGPDLGEQWTQDPKGNTAETAAVQKTWIRAL